ncbi:uncharacterized protein METZ01_LOCUS10966 [marine metagenome]|uniref:Uncharacterized protein n=1 Tax=marine metagenome TaxID=408172 RepID=A0A381NU42_9ZZZZ
MDDHDSIAAEVARRIVPIIARSAAD